MAQAGKSDRQPGRPPEGAAADRRLCLGVVVGTHGVRGVVKIKSFTEDPRDVGAYGPLTDESGRHSYELTVHGVHKGALLAGLSGVDNREAAQALKGLRLHVERDALPEVEEEDAFYYADLIGLRVEGVDGTDYGSVTHVDDHGAGDVIEVTDARGKIRVWPFTKAIVPTVDLDAGRLVVDPPPEVGEPEKGEAAEIAPNDLARDGRARDGQDDGGAR